MYVFLVQALIYRKEWVKLFSISANWKSRLEMALGYEYAFLVELIQKISEKKSHALIQNSFLISLCTHIVRCSCNSTSNTTLHIYCIFLSAYNITHFVNLFLKNSELWLAQWILNVLFSRKRIWEMCFVKLYHLIYQLARICPNQSWFLLV